MSNCLIVFVVGCRQADGPQQEPRRWAWHGADQAVEENAAHHRIQASLQNQHRRAENSRGEVRGMQF